MLRRLKQRQKERKGNGWTPIPGYPGYDITEDGTVRRWWEWAPTDHLEDEPVLVPQQGRYDRMRIWEIVEKSSVPPWRLSSIAVAFPLVSVCRCEAKARLLLRTFDRLPKPGEVARHLNDILSDNSLGNLAWGTPLDNVRDAMRNGRFKRKKTR